MLPADLAAATLPVGLGALLFLGTLHLQRVLGFTALETGLAYLLLSLPVVAASPAASFLAGRYGRRPVAAGGLLLQAAGLLLLLGAGPDDGFLTGVAPGFVLVGGGAPIAWVPLTAAAVEGAGDQSGLASGLFNTAQRSATPSPWPGCPPRPPPAAPAWPEAPRPPRPSWPPGTRPASWPPRPCACSAWWPRSTSPGRPRSASRRRVGVARARLDAELVALGVVQDGDVLEPLHHRRPEPGQPLHLLVHAGQGPQVEVEPVGGQLGAAAAPEPDGRAAPGGRLDVGALGGGALVDVRAEGGRPEAGHPEGVVAVEGQVLDEHGHIEPQWQDGLDAQATAGDGEREPHRGVRGAGVGAAGQHRPHLGIVVPVHRRWAGVARPRGDRAGQGRARGGGAVAGPGGAAADRARGPGAGRLPRGDLGRAAADPVPGGPAVDRLLGGRHAERRRAAGRGRLGGGAAAPAAPPGPRRRPADRVRRRPGHLLAPAPGVAGDHARGRPGRARGGPLRPGRQPGRAPPAALRRPPGAAPGPAGRAGPAAAVRDPGPGRLQLHLAVGAGHGAPRGARDGGRLRAHDHPGRPGGRPPGGGGHLLHPGGGDRAGRAVPRRAGRPGRPGRHRPGRGRGLADLEAAVTLARATGTIPGHAAMTRGARSACGLSTAGAFRTWTSANSMTSPPATGRRPSTSGPVTAATCWPPRPPSRTGWSSASPPARPPWPG